MKYRKMDGKAWFCIQGTTSLVCFDTLSEGIDVYKTDIVESFHNLLPWTEHILISLPGNQGVVEFDEKEKIFRHIWDFSDLVVNEGEPLFISEAGDRLLVCKGLSSEMLLYDRSGRRTGILSFSSQFRGIYKRRNYRANFTGAIRQDGKIYYLPFGANRMLIMDESSLSVEEKLLRSPYQRHLIGMALKHGIAYEGTKYNLNTFVKYVSDFLSGN
jgi:hypothetical protein